MLLRSEHKHDPSTLSAYWSQPIDCLLAGLQSTPSGLSAADARQRLLQSGPNALDTRRHISAIRLFLNQIRTPLVLILIVAAVISAIVQEWVDASIILIIVFGSALLSFAQEYRASTAVEKLRARVNVKATALRDRQPQAILSEAVVPGDVILLVAGSLIPADGVLLEANDCFVNQAVLTGESFPVEKQPGLTAVDAPWPRAPTASSWAPPSGAAPRVSSWYTRGTPPSSVRSPRA